MLVGIIGENGTVLAVPITVATKPVYLSTAATTLLNKFGLWLLLAFGLIVCLVYVIISVRRRPIPEATTPLRDKRKYDATTNDLFIYDQVKQRYDFEVTRSHNLDDKAGNLVGWIGLIISIVSLSSGVLFTKSGETLTIPSDAIWLLAILFLSLPSQELSQTRSEVIPGQPLYQERVVVCAIQVLHI
jgi:hypothetical protein